MGTCMCAYEVCACEGVCVCTHYMKGCVCVPKLVPNRWPTFQTRHTYCPSACVLLVDVSVGVNKELSEATVTVLTGVEEGGHVVPGCGVCECEGVSGMVLLGRRGLYANVPNTLHCTCN